MDQVSFKVRDLLGGAPIGQAARNQLLLGPASIAERIRAEDCLRRLRESRGGASQGGPDQSWLAEEDRFAERKPLPPPSFRVRDLFADGAQVGRVTIEDKLELEVNPSSVRAVKLEEEEEEEH